jgi:hypothetical protein
MTRIEALRKLEAYIKCINIKHSEDCDYDCSNCKLGLEQGNHFLINEALKMAFNALQEDLYNKATILEKLEQAKRKNDHVFNRYNKYYVLSLENYYNDVDNILCDLIKEFNK